MTERTPYELDQLSEADRLKEARREMLARAGRCVLLRQAKDFPTAWHEDDL